MVTLMFAVIVYLGQLEYFSWYDLRNCTLQTTLVVSQALLIIATVSSTPG